ncbi:MAG: hypothetical protein IKP00_05010 [Victivallales bacterium]|nr:hypothetical protein [Victivallales bacterium]
MGFASPLSRLRFTHGYALAAANAATFHARLRSTHGFAPRTALPVPPLSRLCSVGEV